MDVEYLLDNKVSEPRLFFLDSSRRSLKERVRLEKEIDDCRTHRVYVTVRPRGRQPSWLCLYMQYVYICV